MGKLFGTDGVRGVANRELTSELAYKIGKAGAYVLTAEMEHTPKILIGMDTRISGDMLEAALTAGICSMGAQVVSLGILPTPSIAYLTRFYNADAGIVISASHNPFEFNGIKFFDKKGYKLSDELEEKIESIIFDDNFDYPKPEGKDIGKRIYYNTALEKYVDFVTSTAYVDLKGIKVAIDCANGAACLSAPKAFQKLGVEVKVINDSPDGININKNCGSTYLKDLQEFVKNNDCDLGFAFDGDADRVLAVDENGAVIDGDKIMAIIGNNLKKKGKLKNNTIVTTVMSNIGFDVMAKESGIGLSKTQVGDRYVLQEMLEKDYILGGEQSGHIIFLDYNTTGDGLLSAIQLLCAYKESSKKMSELALIMNIFPQVLINAKVSNDKKNNYLDDIIIKKLCEEIEEEFHGNGRVLIRPSGTEPLVRVMIEGTDIEYIEKRAKELVKVIEERLS